MVWRGVVCFIHGSIILLEYGERLCFNSEPAFLGGTGQPVALSGFGWASAGAVTTDLL